MTKSVLLLRLSYWVAAIADFVIAILAWIPERMGVTEIVYPGGLASVVAFSWGVMLLIADRKPIERKWILIPTILVVALIAVIRTKFSLDGPIEFSLVLLLFAVALIILMAYSYYYANSMQKISNTNHDVPNRALQSDKMPATRVICRLTRALGATNRSFSFRVRL